MKLHRRLGCVVLCGLLGGGASNADETPVDRNLVLALRASVQHTPSFSNRMDALIWMADMSERLKGTIADPFYRVGLVKTIHTEATRARVKPELVLALIEVESRFDRFAVSRSGARGLMQVMPFWKKEIGHPQDNLFDPHTNLRYGCTILRYYLDANGGDVEAALASYNGSFGQLEYPNKVLLAFSETWRPSHYQTLAIE